MVGELTKEREWNREVGLWGGVDKIEMAQVRCGEERVRYMIVASGNKMTYSRRYLCIGLVEAHLVSKKITHQKFHHEEQQLGSCYVEQAKWTLETRAGGNLSDQRSDVLRLLVARSLLPSTIGTWSPPFSTVCRNSG